ncbi:MAG: hypothetical protein GY870_13335 [archaeon]|nr:hypothetical protein [archaeon]
MIRPLLKLKKNKENIEKKNDEIVTEEKIKFSAIRFKGINKEIEIIEIIKMCSYCKMVYSPNLDLKSKSDWLSPEKYFYNKKQEDVKITHGICPNCFEKVLVDLNNLP